MSTATKVIAVVGVLGVAGLGLYLYLKSQKKGAVSPEAKTPTHGVPGSDVKTGAGTLVPSDLPSTEDLRGGAKHVLAETKQNAEKAAEILFKDSPVPLPTDMSFAEIQNLNDFCSLPEGKTLICATVPKLSEEKCFNINTKYGLATVLRERSNPGSDWKEYYKKLISWQGC